MIVLISPFSIFWLLLNVTIYFRYSKLRKSPGNIFIGTIFTEILNILIFTAYPFNFMIFNHNVLEHSTQCQLLSFVNSYSETSLNLYYFVFCYYIYRFTNNSLNEKFLPFNMHLFVLIVSTCYVAFKYMSSQFGQKSNGICGTVFDVHASEMSLGMVLKSLFVLLFVILTIWTNRILFKKRNSLNLKYSKDL